jgi:hypothetical protein
VTSARIAQDATRTALSLRQTERIAWMAFLFLSRSSPSVWRRPSLSRCCMGTTRRPNFSLTAGGHPVARPPSVDCRCPVRPDFVQTAVRVAGPAGPDLCSAVALPPGRGATVVALVLISAWLFDGGGMVSLDRGPACPRRRYRHGGPFVSKAKYPGEPYIAACRPAGRPGHPGSVRGGRGNPGMAPVPECRHRAAHRHAGNRNVSSLVLHVSVRHAAADQRRPGHADATVADASGY